MRQGRTLLPLLGAALLAACGGTDPGVGSKTLYVKAHMSTDGSTDGTQVSVEVREGSASGASVSDATVTLKGQKGTEVQVPLVVQGNNPRYTRDAFAWEPGFVLMVRRGNTDSLDAALEMPGVTVITEPVAGTTFSKAAGKPLTVKWRDEYGRGAQFPEVRLEKADIRQTLTNDVFTYDVEAARLVVDGSERVTVTRTNKVSLAGGLPGSEWTATTSHRIEFKVE